MAQYIVLVKGGKGANLKELGTEARNLFIQRWNKWLSELNEKKMLVTGAPLHSGGLLVHGSGSTESVPENYDMVADMVTGFFVINSADEPTARLIAKSCPFLEDEFTSCEIRELK